MLEAKGITEAPQKAKEEIYTSKWETVKEYSLDEKVPKRLVLPKEEGKEKRYYIRYYNSIRIIRRTAKKEMPETPEEKARKEKEEKKKKIRDIMKEMNARKQLMITGIINGEIPQVKEVAEVQEEIWRVLVSLDALLCKSSMITVLAGSSYYLMPEKEREEWHRKIRGMDCISQMLLSLGYELGRRGEPFDWDMKHNKENSGRIRQSYAVLERYGWTFTEEEKAVLDGTHEFYEKEDGEPDQRG